MSRVCVLRILAGAVVACALTGCFTGIESTPRITGDAVRQAGVTVSSEQEYMGAVVPEPPARWRPGKEWQVADDKIGVIFTAASESRSLLAGTRMSLLGAEPYLGVAGDTLVELAFTTAAHDTLLYRPGATMADFRRRRSLEIPFTVELSAVHVADSLLRGRTLYITTPQWRDASGALVQGLRHVAVKVDSVAPGTDRYPLRLCFTPEDSGGRAYSVLMTYGHGAAATRNFERLFAFDNPRLKYPRITPATWELIVHSRVTDGMSRDECRLALGAPASIDRAANNGGQYERWNYDQGIYLIFEDGILIRYRQ